MQEFYIFLLPKQKENLGDISFFNGNSIAIDSNGYLGIGTTAPKTKLHVNSSMVIGSSGRLPATGYLLSVAGKIICEELKLQLNAAWPDYVFRKKLCAAIIECAGRNGYDK